MSSLVFTKFSKFLFSFRILQKLKVLFEKYEEKILFQTPPTTALMSYVYIPLFKRFKLF
jgi:hypothetical protein